MHNKLHRDFYLINSKHFPNCWDSLQSLQDFTEETFVMNSAIFCDINLNEIETVMIIILSKLFILTTNSFFILLNYTFCVIFRDHLKELVHYCNSIQMLESWLHYQMFDYCQKSDNEVGNVNGLLFVNPNMDVFWFRSRWAEFSSLNGDVGDEKTFKSDGSSADAAFPNWKVLDPKKSIENVSLK